MRDTEKAFNVWASAIHHRAGGADGHPAPAEVHTEPQPGSTAQSQALRSDLVYDATRDKYDEHSGAKVELHVAAMIEAVERALAHCRAGAAMRRYLLFKYPTRGRFAPKKRTKDGEDPLDDTAAAFVASGHWDDALCRFGSVQYRKYSVRTIEAAERELTKRLKIELANGQRRRCRVLA